MSKTGQARAKSRAVSGVLLLDKPIGLSSNAALQRAKRLFNAAKAGHTGSLDPLATGMLPLCFGEATKFSQLMLDADKCYLCRIKLGIRTATGDAEGEIVARREVQGIGPAEVEAALQRFVGDIEQIPSMYSALKYNGQPLYRLARRGIEVERKARPISIRRISLLKMESDELEIELECSKGTYVRSLADDLGELLSCGAHVTGLRRLWVKGFAGRTMHRLADIEQAAASAMEHDYAVLDSLLLPVTALVQGLPEVEVTDLLSHYLKQGQAVFVPQVNAVGKVVLLNKDAGEAQRFIGVGEVLDDGRVAPRRLVATG